MSFQYLGDAPTCERATAESRDVCTDSSLIICKWDRIRNLDIHNYVGNHSSPFFVAQSGGILYRSSRPRKRGVASKNRDRANDTERPFIAFSKGDSYYCPTAT